jgi:hypothetical protein
MTSHPSGEVILRILGFAPQHCTGKNYQRVVRDPIIDERRVEAYKRRPGWPDDPMLWNIFCTYKRVPARRDEAHLNFPDNFNIQDDACVLAIFNKMTEQERLELRERVLDQELQTAIGKVIHEDFLAMQQGDFSRADSTGRIAAVLSEWQEQRKPTSR